MSDDRAEFSVVEFLNDGTHRYVRRWLDAENAVYLAHYCTRRLRDDVERVVITDGGDFTVFQWERGKGVTFK